VTNYKTIASRFQAEKEFRESVYALFLENDANHDGFLDQADLVGMFRKYELRTQKGKNGGKAVS
jgi:hypothetical protein